MIHFRIVRRATTPLFLNSINEILYNELLGERRRSWEGENDGSNTIDSVDRTLVVAPSAFVPAITESRDIHQLIDGIAQPASAELSQLSPAVKSQPQSVESEFEPLAN